MAIKHFVWFHNALKFIIKMVVPFLEYSVCYVKFTIYIIVPLREQFDV